MTEAKVLALPPCDFCVDETPAQYDAKTQFGSWANMCERHMIHYHPGGPENLGMGIGQKLVVVDAGR
jgi:hypothetical protein